MPCFSPRCSGMQDQFLPYSRWMRFASASKANKEKTMKTMMKKLWRLGIVDPVAVNLLQNCDWPWPV